MNFLKHLLEFVFSFPYVRVVGVVLTPGLPAGVQLVSLETASPTFLFAFCFQLRKSKLSLAFRTVWSSVGNTLITMMEVRRWCAPATSTCHVSVYISNSSVVRNMIILTPVICNVLDIFIIQF